jgi:hypothetical protein
MTARWNAAARKLAAKNAKQMWVNRVWHKLVCQECGQEYRSPFLSKSKFCHAYCRVAAWRRRQGCAEHGRRVVTKLSGKQLP